MARHKKQHTDDVDLHAALPLPEACKRRRAWERVSKEFTQWQPAAEALTLVRSVPTRFVQFDRATRCGGLPIERITTVHGPSNHGKSEFCIGLVGSFLGLDHAAAWVDAEFTTPRDWLERMIGRELLLHPGFFAVRPDNQEQVVNAVREFCNGLDRLRAEGELEQDTSGLVVVDSVRKLIPKDLLDEVLKVAKSDKKVEMLTGRTGQVKAQAVQAWLDELVPLLGHTGTAVIMIAREFDKEGADAKDRKFDNAWAVAGTKGLIFDASLVLRVTRAGWLYEGSDDDDKKVIGERHRVRIWKTKVEGKEGRFTDCFYHTSNGALYPAGFDRARDVLELAEHYGVVQKRGNWYAYGEERIAQGMNNCCRLLNGRPDWLGRIEADVRSAFRPDEELPGGEGEGDDEES